MPTSSAPTRPGVFVTATASRSSSVVPASSMARWTTGTMLVRGARDAISGTTPPKTRCTSCDKMTRDFCSTSSPLPSSTAADVSSHDVSMPRMRVMLLRPLGEQAIDEGAGVGRVPVRRLHQLLSDDAISADDEGLRITGDIVLVGDLRLRVVQNLERQAVLPRKGADCRVGAGIVDADGEDAETLRAVILVQRLDARHLDAAR